MINLQKLLKNNKIETKLFTDVQGTEESFRGLSGKHIKINSKRCNIK